ncbi:SDR family NAD(P)-dependent oxidoreductase [Ochrobactrum vermis]|uniref:SDR family NAD(P)-dependent oxidoreductase n=1 Tax=Ochrobactrum vermis TaxID=1827297 RepID=A0ABU8PKD1_9HYPH|nr:SDR family NAD(P)-dependent oxidoreductase [Ochrobactrum vermis]PQZ26748.1 oxidoreductase [Ochrobactrum vermis]
MTTNNAPTAFPTDFFADRVVLVTGGASGIGKAVAEKLIALQAKVVLWDVNGARLQEMADKHGDRVLTAIVDVSDKAAVDRAAHDIAEKWGGIDHLVNNAGIIGQRMTVKEFDAEELDRVLAVNLKSVFYVSSAYLNNLGAKSDKSVIGLSSIAGRTGGMVGNIAYATTKGAIASYTYALAKELAPEIRVNALAPGVIDTEIQKAVFADPANIAKMADLIPLKRLGTADEVADAAIWLLSPGAAYITGVVLDVSGGR